MITKEERECTIASIQYNAKMEGREEGRAEERKKYEAERAAYEAEKAAFAARIKELEAELARRVISPLFVNRKVLKGTFFLLRMVSPHYHSFLADFSILQDCRV